MKKISAFLCIILVAVAMSACSTFYDDTTKNYPQSNPMQTTIFLQIKAIPVGSTLDIELTNWKAAVLTQQPTQETATKIIDINYATETSTVYRAELTLQNVPDSTAEKTVRPFQIFYTQKIYNPLALLPDSDVFQYNILFGAEHRHSSASTQDITYDNGEYVYYWTDATPIEFTDVYPNRPLYIIIIIASAVVIGVITYLISRYYDCKKRKHQL